MMEIDPELLALRHADRPGCRFVGYREVAIPVFFMTLRAVIIRERSLPTADEFILRCIQTGIATIDACAGFLGLSKALVEHRIVELRTKELVELDNDASPPRLVLTAAGAVTARQLSVRELREETLSGVPVHGWTRRPIACTEAESMAPIEADEAGMIKLRPVPSRHPEATEIDARALTSTLSGLNTRGSDAVAEVLSVRAVLKGVKTRFLPALMMQWQSNAGGKPQIGFIVDGRIDEELERCFGAMKGSEVFSDLLASGPQSAEQLLESAVPQQMQERVRRTLVSEREARAISQTSLELQAERQTVQQVEPDPSRPDTRAVQAERLKEFEAKFKKMELALGNRPRQIWTTDIRHNFGKSLQIAKERLIIVSAFINDDVVNAEFISSLRAAIRRGAKVYLGIGDDNMAQGDAWKRDSRNRALASIDRLRQEHPDGITVAQRHHHAKILVCDSKFAMTGSYNFLSFRGDHRKVRDEQAVLLCDPADIDDVVKDVMKRFFSPSPSPPGGRA
jgi:hypothetical protein